MEKYLTKKYTKGCNTRNKRIILKLKFIELIMRLNLLYFTIGACIALASCKPEEVEELKNVDTSSLCDELSFEKVYTETIVADDNYSDHKLFCAFSHDYLKATINFNANNLYGSLGAGCDGDWNKTTGFTFNGVQPHDNSGRFVHRVSDDLQNLELGYYVHRLGTIVTRDAQGVINGSQEVNDLFKGYIMDVTPGQDYLVEIIRKSKIVEFYVGDSLVQTVDIPEVPEGNNNYCYFYHGGDCAAPQEVSYTIIYHQK